MTDQLTIAWTDEAGRRRRLRLTKRAPGGWERRVEELSAGEWRPVGDGIVADLAVTVGADVLADDVLEFAGSQTARTVQGP